MGELGVVAHQSVTISTRLLLRFVNSTKSSNLDLYRTEPVADRSLGVHILRSLWDLRDESRASS
jgi:hypothetical protein